MFNKFADDARQVVVAAQQEAQDANDPQIAPVHLLLGIADGSGPGAQTLRAAGLTTAGVRALLASGVGDLLDPGALASLGIDLDEVRERAEASFGKGALDRGRLWSRSRPGRRTMFAPGSKHALERALRHAVRRGDKRLTSGHLLAGLLVVEDESVGAVLHASGIDPTDLSADLEQRMGREAA